MSQAMKGAISTVLKYLAGCLLLSQLIFVLGAGLAYVSSDGEVGAALFGKYYLVYLDGDASATPLLQEATEAMADFEPALVGSAGERGLRLYLPRGERRPPEELSQLGARHGFEMTRISTGIRFPETLRRFAADPLSRVNQQSVGWMLLPSPLCFLLVGWLARRRHAPPQPSSLSAAQAFGIGAAVGVSAYGLAFALEALTSLLGLPVQEQQLVLQLLEQRNGLFYLFLVVAVILGPLGEEFFFRGFAFDWLLERRGALLAHLVSGGLFTAVHFNPSGIPIYFLLAVILAESYRRWRNLLIPVVAHSLLNAITLGRHLFDS